MTTAGAGAGIARSLVAVAAVAALACTAACGPGGSGGPDGSDRNDRGGKSSRSTAETGRADGGGRSGTPAGGTPGNPGGPEEGRGSQEGRATPGPRGTGKERRTAGALTEARLRKAVLVTGDVEGYEFEESGGAGLLGRTSPATPSKCGPIADMFLFATTPAFEAGVSRGVGAKDELDASVTTLALLSYDSDGADEVIDGLRSATRSCTSYRHGGYDYGEVKAADAPDLGDESVAFRLVASIEGAQVPTAYTVVRDGTTLVAFSSMNMLRAGGAEVPVELVEAQLTKLAGVARRGEGPRG
ncbi:hypothetical protein [Streptomyces beigongshangae]|uniref:hypothetical protein n=1 Tax=Streptomyces beigongshangae TaxID=2841597 RepID=UPI001C84DFFD|nr:hypothetical protein [Streptomyces sp. REN17]